MSEYKVIWEIEIEAESAEEAARKAFEIQRDPDSIATVFNIKAPNGEEFIIDLLEWD